MTRVYSNLEGSGWTNLWIEVNVALKANGLGAGDLALHPSWAIARNPR